MNPKAMVLQDLPDLYPGSTRAGIEKVLQTIDDRPTEDESGASVASALMPIVPGIAARLFELVGSELADYLRVLRGAAVFILQKWAVDTNPPSYATIRTAVEALEG